MNTKYRKIKGIKREGERVTERGVLISEAEIGERRSVGEALEEAVEVAGVSEVFEAFVREEIEVPSSER